MIKRKSSDRVQIGLRLREDLRRKLESQANDHNISINGEIESRLERSFLDEEIRKAELRHEFGGPRNLALARIVALMAKSLEVMDTPDYWWSDNPAVFKELRVAINTLLDELEPPNEGTEGRGPETVISGRKLAVAVVSHLRYPSRWGEIEWGKLPPGYEISPEILEEHIDRRIAYDASAHLRRMIDRRGRKQ